LDDVTVQSAIAELLAQGRTLPAIEEWWLKRVLEQALIVHGNQSAAAEALGVHRNTFTRNMQHSGAFRQVGTRRYREVRDDHAA
jgi:transcriptional regulator with AAA-type ATPase domain